MTDDDIGKDTARDPEREASGPPAWRHPGRCRKSRREGSRRRSRRRRNGRRPRRRRRPLPARRQGKPPGPRRSGTSLPRPGRRTHVRDHDTTKVSAARPKAAVKAAATASGAAAFGSAARGGRRERTGRACDPAPRGQVVDGSAAGRPLRCTPGAYTDPAPEQSGGLGSLLTLWGPLIIVGFLVLVFRGGVERGGTVAAASDAPAPTGRGSGHPGAGCARIASRRRGGVRRSPASGSARPVPPAPPDAGPRKRSTAGFTMRTSMAGGPGVCGPRAPVRRCRRDCRGGSIRRPPGPLPRLRGTAGCRPTRAGRRPAPATGLTWSAGAREDVRHEDGGDAPAQWVRCAPPYYWCPAPGNPIW